MNELINLLERKHLIWRGCANDESTDCLSSGFALFDEKTNGGFPRQGVIEVSSEWGIGELRLLYSVLKEKVASRLLVLIQPPGYVNAAYFQRQGIALDKVLVISPSAPNDALWAAEQCLKSGACGAVLLWQEEYEIHQIKRLQMAAETGDSLQWLFHLPQPQRISLPVTLSLALTPDENGTGVEVVKRKGGWSKGRFVVDMRSVSPQLTVRDSRSSNAAAHSSTVVAFPQLRRG
uniref:translesion DNA synthesis-associated protein ImuA n=1 Tax=Thaumasiovibrio occultus TaxID=1891184 RepID=UPI000B3622D0|nr:translesion DNA synthesis-associated protein ImuA [Thaumasiovibrio occultus]